MPMTELEITTPANSASGGYPPIRISTNRVEMMALTGVRTLARTI